MSVPTPGPRPGDPRPPEQRPVADLRADVDEAVAGLDSLAERPVSEHPEAFERVHSALGRALTAGSERG
ncbi:hypothetical protein Ae168Ps1_0004 [Pseudonocardia sp. Ae168_Ps1]|uniref:hypothetical protein n=1 Tax=unclassified Pseudonocardia TaxID=2619320 RepID=UPI0001FFECFF|nr:MULTISPECIES: hypothetical protein [unclassified Pseudonocardia]ALE73840.1 hypothetical protein FRP1_13765 [Pseudonocardia sp. EC080625-04]ALL77233.1 hypothetical protein AD006_21440 [Pseudonocardia sp. EC080610-09]ALL80148.1 hypothetical protein AD017_01020 [Pseudonocardia sp. EC080619-01]OLL71625.1 hypothetical protein Ae150APs1_0003 [Pseudonocardia sp. Ae150A_Ps1]OLL77598.1 hypothetical protein Ae168Ps1_0004 [Pseudonocardia sp. Ae168_Ps1]